MPAGCSSSRAKKRQTSRFSIGASSSGKPFARHATRTETFAAKSLKRSASARSATSANASSTKRRICASWRRTTPGVKSFASGERSCVCSGGSIRFTIGVTGWTFVSRCDAVVPSAAE